MNKSYIYLLLDPTTKNPRYVGKTKCPQQRFIQHLNPDSNILKATWVCDLRKGGTPPIMEVVEACSAKDSREREWFWIHKIKSSGRSLLNSPCITAAYHGAAIDAYGENWRTKEYTSFRDWNLWLEEVRHHNSRPTASLLIDS